MDWEPQDLTPDQRKEFSDAYFQKMMYGLLWAGGGALITVLTMSSGRGGILCFGAIIYGIFDFFRGLSGYMKYR